MSEERSIRRANFGQPSRVKGLAQLAPRPVPEGLDGVDYRQNCFLCGTHTNGSALTEERIVEIEAGVGMASLKIGKEDISDKDELCAVCCNCANTIGLAPIALKMKEIMKM